MKNLEKQKNQPLGASFRDPSGCVFNHDGIIYRYISPAGLGDYELLMQSGLYQDLVERDLLITHKEVEKPIESDQRCGKFIRPLPIDFLSYPYEWSFSQLKDAAILTLKIQQVALEYGMILKDASAFNVQFQFGRPIFIDTLSFTAYEEGKPWIAYKQFCSHFLAPLSLMAYRDSRMGQLFRIFLDGIPLEIARKLLPFKTIFSPSLLLHIKLHARSQKHYGNKKIEAYKSNFSLQSMKGLIDSLMGAIDKLTWQPVGTEWADYYDETNYSDKADKSKLAFVENAIKTIHPSKIWDLGANTGRYSRIASKYASHVVSFDLDIAAVEQNYITCKKGDVKNILPLVMDFNNPSGGIGWNNQERISLIERGPADLVLGLALIHHLAISNNLPYEYIARFLAEIGEYLLIEFVPPGDSQSLRLLANRKSSGLHDISKEAFEAAFAKYFTIELCEDVEQSVRTCYLMKIRI